MITEVFTVDIIDEHSIPAFIDSNQLIIELESVDIYNNVIAPVHAKEYEIQPEIKVPYHIEIEQNTQKSVDEGHSPWRLDPLFTTQVFVSVHLFPDGIVGDYPIEEENLKLIHSDVELAIVEVNDEDTNIKRVYLKRVVRQDPTGIWTVIGYDVTK